MSVVGIGASAGGLEAIREMLEPASRDTPLAFVVVQHLDPNHESHLAELIDRHTALEVHQAAGGEKVEAGKVYIIPPGHGLTIEDGVLKLTDFAQPRGLRRPIDDFFERLAVDQGRLAACVILSGTGADGSSGLRAIKEHGGLCIAQEPDSARYDGMPRAAANTGLVDFLRTPDKIIETILRFFSTQIDGNGEELVENVKASIDDICAALYRTVGHDFSGYKPSTLARRIERRFQILELRDADAYLKRIKSDPEECETLLRELLINVTRFFRDGAHFEKLRGEVIEPMVRNSDGRDIRVWVPGCSSGEEVYSIAMLFAEEVRRQKKAIMIQIFATDIDEQMLRIARQGTYPVSALADIPESFRERYTVAREGRFQIAGRVRDMVRFSLHSVVRDPPFSNIDLLSCRNLLIYFGERLQATALPIFHYAVRPGGVLFLGPSETIGRFESLFRPIDAQARIYRRNDETADFPKLHGSGRTPFGTSRSGESRDSDGEPVRVDWRRGTTAERVLKNYAPATLHVSPSGEILSSTGKLGRYLSVEPGRGETRHAQAVALPGLREAISAIIREASQKKQRSVARDLSARSEFGAQTFDLIADPLPDGTLLLVFRDRDRFEPMEEDDLIDVEASDSHVQGLEEELRATRSRLHVTVEELETANEELKSSNEEMMSMNEELQSTNEELATVNDELKSKIDELSLANSDLYNLFASTSLPLIVVNRKLEVRNYTEAIQTIFPLRDTDRGRPLTDVTSVLNGTDMVIDAVHAVLDANEPRRLDVTERSGSRIWSLNVTPYRVRDGSINGATLIFTDVTEALSLQEALKSEKERLRLALESSGLGVWEYDPALRLIRFDERCATLLGSKSMSDGNVAIDAVMSCLRPEAQDDIAASFDALASQKDTIDETLPVRLASGEPRVLHLLGNRVNRQMGRRFVGVLSDVTASEEAERVREMMLREMNHRIKNLFSIISGMLRVTGRSAKTVPELIERVEARISALARSHNLSGNGNAMRDAQLGEVIEAAIGPHAEPERCQFGGPPVRVSPQNLTSLALIFHEWATNAAKYGVLGPVPGRLDVRWERESDDRVRVYWNEVYDSDVETKKDGAGFGSTLIDLTVAQIGGTVDIEQTSRQRAMRLTYDPSDKSDERAPGEDTSV